MKVGQYLRALLAEAKENHGIDGSFEEARYIGVGYQYYIYLWTDDEKSNRKRRGFSLTDEFLREKSADEIEKQIRPIFDELVEEFLS